MKRLHILSLGVALTLLSCGGEEATDESTSADNGQSSVVANTDPAPTTNRNDRFKEAAESTSNSDDAKNSSLTEIKYLQEKHNFGNVMFPSENLYTFKFQNVGSKPLIIESATASCGCTVPDPPKEPIAPGEIGELDVIFRPKKGQVGQSVTKRVTVTANTSPKETFLEISAKVVESMNM